VRAPAISVRHVTKRFAWHQALDSVTLEIAPKESVVVLGASGSGKTTLLRLIAGLEVPDSGEIWLGDVQVAGPGQSPCRRIDVRSDSSSRTSRCGPT
jgi:iron(III) transport system ATP-binding protein